MTFYEYNTGVDTIIQRIELQAGCHQFGKTEEHLDSLLAT
jgi:hypothetical protein